MLTKDLIKFTRSGVKITPKFIDVENEYLLSLVEKLLMVYNPENQPLHKTIKEEVSLLIKIQTDLKLAKGLNKIILDRCEFSNNEDMDYCEIRKDLFAKTAGLLNDSNSDIDSYKNEIKNHLQKEYQTSPDMIYSDLPENEYLVKIKKLYAKEVLERYNCSLVQSLLLYSDEITLKIEESDISKIRKMFKYLKFFRLTSEISSVKNTTKKTKDNKLIIKIDGPTTILKNSKKYGLQLASFFPAICDLEKWEIFSEIKLNNNRYTLKVNQKSKLVSHYKNFIAYIPDEVRMFHKLFNKESDEWDITGKAPFFRDEDNNIIFPDLSFINEKTKEVVHLELFHRWHSYQLEKRIQFCDKNMDLPFIIGVDRFLYKQKDIKEMLDNSSFFQKKGYLFSDFPNVNATKKILNNNLVVN